MPGGSGNKTRNDAPGNGENTKNRNYMDAICEHWIRNWYAISSVSLSAPLTKIWCSQFGLKITSVHLAVKSKNRNV